MNTKSIAEQIRNYFLEMLLEHDIAVNDKDVATIDGSIQSILSQGSEPSVDEVVGELKDILKYSGKDFQANKENQHKFLNLINEIASKLLKRLEKK